jgi:hypothetical protein
MHQLYQYQYFKLKIPDFEIGKILTEVGDAHI